VSQTESPSAHVPAGIKRLVEIGFWAGVFRNLYAAIAAKVPFGYEDAAGFHFGEKPPTEQSDDTLSFGM